MKATPCNATVFLKDSFLILLAMASNLVAMASNRVALTMMFWLVLLWLLSVAPCAGRAQRDAVRQWHTGRGCGMCVCVWQ